MSEEETKITLQRSAAIEHHLTQGVAWLTASNGGRNTAALSYAAFEFRLATERVALQYWSDLIGEVTDADLGDLSSFKRMENRIYSLAGHQKTINAHFEFARVWWDMLDPGVKIATPNLRDLSSRWHGCSELCHIGWTMFCTDEATQKQAYDFLQETRDVLLAQTPRIGWPKIQDETFRELRDRFVAGHATAADIEAHVRKVGMWGLYTAPDGTKSFLGRAIPPQGMSEPDERPR